MIEDLVKIHDKFSVEIKLGFNARRKTERSDFAVNTWIFIPNSLDINRSTYQKTDFYRDLKSNIRLITPVYLLREIAKTDAEPFSLLGKSFIIRIPYTDVCFYCEKCSEGRNTAHSGQYR
jgi:hypothetical protein